MCCTDYGLGFQKQFWKLLFSSSFESWEHVSQAHKGCSLSRLLLSAPALPLWVATCPSYMSFLSKRYIYLEANHRGFLICAWWGAEKRNCSLLILPEIQNRNHVRLFISIPMDRDLGEGELQEQPQWPWSQSPLTHGSSGLFLELRLLWALGPALALHFPELWYLYPPLKSWQALSNTWKWNFPMEHIINLVSSAKVSCHSSNINVIEPWILPLYFYRTVMVWHFQSCPGGTV